MVRPISIWQCAAFVALVVAAGCKPDAGKSNAPRQSGLESVQFRSIDSTEGQSLQPGTGKAIGSIGSRHNSTVIALLIGINESPPLSGLAPLKGAVADMEKLQEALIAVGVPLNNIKLLLDTQATEANVFKSLSALSSVARENDLVILAYAGHGGSENGRSFVMTRAQRTDLGELLTRFGQVPAKKRVFFVDACRSGQRTDVSFRVSTDAVDRAGSLAWIASCSANEDSIEYGGRGLFMEELANGITNAASLDRNRNSVLEFHELASWLQNRVSTRAAAIRGSQKSQTPYSDIVRWSGDQGLLEVVHKWSIVAGKPNPSKPAVPVHGTYDVNAVGPGQKLWIVVAPRQSPGQCWPMDEGLQEFRNGQWRGTAYLGTSGTRGESFRILLVRANPTLTEQFRAFLRRKDDFGVVMKNIPAMAEVEVER